MATLTRFWKSLDGRKTYLGVLLWLVASVLWDADVLSEQTYDWLLPWVKTLTGVGVLHKIQKKSPA